MKIIDTTLFNKYSLFNLCKNPKNKYERKLWHIIQGELIIGWLGRVTNIISYANFSGKHHFITTLQIYDNVHNISPVLELLIFNDLQNNLEGSFPTKNDFAKILYSVFVLLAITLH